MIARGRRCFRMPGRFASIIERHNVTIFKAGSTFLKAVMTDPASTNEMAALRYVVLAKRAPFCAEPVSPAGATVRHGQYLLARYINSYWATEHGGIVFSCPWKATIKDLFEADAKTWRIALDSGTGARCRSHGQRWARSAPWREAEAGEKGELVITAALPLPRPVPSGAMAIDLGQP